MLATTCSDNNADCADWMLKPITNQKFTHLQYDKVCKQVVVADKIKPKFTLLLAKGQDFTGCEPRTEAKTIIPIAPMHALTIIVAMQHIVALLQTSALM